MRHRVSVHAQTWRNVAPYAPCTLYRAVCSCGATGEWCRYRENVGTPTCGGQR